MTLASNLVFICLLSTIILHLHHFVLLSHPPIIPSSFLYLSISLSLFPLSVSFSCQQVLPLFSIIIHYIICFLQLPSSMISLMSTRLIIHPPTTVTTTALTPHHPQVTITTTTTTTATAVMMMIQRS